MDRQVESVFDHVHRATALIASHDLPAATEELERALSVDFENEDVVTTLKYSNFWNDRQKHVESLADDFERGEYLLGQWRTFVDFVDRIGSPVESAVNALRLFVFREALGYYRRIYQERDNRDADLLVRIARCYKGTGEFDKSTRFLKSASTERPNDAEILSELADVLALSDEIAQAKAFFREAFFVDAQRINPARLESELIRRLLQAVREHGYDGAALLEWIPVYGFLYGVLNVKRELRSIEVGRLKQSIYELERELREGTGDEALVKPRLINRYFWLIDHYVASKEPQGKIDEVLIKIRSVDIDVYHQFNG